MLQPLELDDDRPVSDWSMSDQASFWPFWRKVLNTNTVEMCEAADAANLD